MLHTFFSWLENHTESFPGAPSSQPPTTFWPYLWHHARPYKRMILASAILSAAVSVVEITIFSFLGDLVDWLQPTSRETLWQDHQGQLWFMSAIVLLVLPLLKLLHSAATHQGIYGSLPMRIRWQTHRYLLRQSIGFFEDDFAGRIATKMMQTAIAVRETVMKVADVLVFVSVYLIGALVVFAANDWRLMLPMLAWFAGYLLLMQYFLPRLREVSMRQAHARSGLTGRVVDSYTNINTVKMFAHTTDEDNYARHSMQHMLTTVHPQMRLVTKLSSSLSLLNSVLLFCIAVLALWLWQHEEISAGAIAVATGITLRMQGISQWIMWEVAGLFEQIGVVQDGIKTLTQPHKTNDAPEASSLQITQGEIKFNDVCFNYAQGTKAGQVCVLDQFSLHVKSGEKIGLVGRSGAGKSTLVNILLRFYDIESGQITISGQDISKVTQDSLRAHIGMVTQDTSLLHRSVTDNIRYGRPSASKEDIINAAKQAHAHDFILGLVDLEGRKGYDAQVGERGVKLSGGQRQRIAIARVLLKNAPILILDEATSALDSEVEAKIQQSLTELMKNKTVIAIAHRLSTIAAMDRLVVMDQGRIVEQGSHNELINKQGIYAQLWARQSGGFIDAK